MFNSAQLTLSRILIYIGWYRHLGKFSLRALRIGALTLLAFSTLTATSKADQNWDADDGAGNFSTNRNWFGDVQPTFSFGNGSLHFAYRNNPSQTSLYFDYGRDVDTASIFFDSTYGQSTPLNGDGHLINFGQKIENNSSYSQFINIPTSGGKNGASQIELNPVNGDLTIGGTIFNDFNNNYHVYGNNGKSLSINSTLGGNSGVAFTNENNNLVTFNALQNYGGATTIKGGSISASTSGALGGTSNVTVNSGGTLLLSGSNAVTTRINDAATITLNGGSFNTNGLSERVGALMLQATSSIDLGSGASSLTFGGATTRAAGMLTFSNWTDGSDHVYFYTDNTGNTAYFLPNDFLSNITINGLGVNQLSTGEIVPVPEPATWFAGFLTLGVAAYGLRRRLRLAV